MNLGLNTTAKLDKYWSNRYVEGLTGWDIGYPSTPIREYIDQLSNKDLRILIPGAGRGYEAEYLFRQGFSQVYILDISAQPLLDFQSRVSDFPKDQLVQANFFEHNVEYDLIIEQTFFCSFEPHKETRELYAKQMHKLLGSGGKLVGLWFCHPLDRDGNRPFGGSKEEYLGYFLPYFKKVQFEPCHNSIKPRAGKELFGILEK